MQVDRLDSEKTIAHELGHELDDLFDANDEYFTTYTYNPGRQKSAYLNIFADGKTIFGDNNAVTNTSVYDIQTKEDIRNYAKNMEDMVYILDGIIATKVLDLPIEEQAKYIRIANVDGENGGMRINYPNADKDQVKILTVEELKQLNIKTIDDLIDNDAVIMQPNDTNHNILGNHGQGYGTTLTYSPFFLVNGKSVQHNHRIINTLLAEDGWEGFKKFNNAYREAYYEDELENSNLEIDKLIAKLSIAALKKVYNDDTLTYRDLVRERYTEAMDNFKEKGLLGESYETVMKDLSSMELSEFYNYKYNMMTRYLQRTNDFSMSVFEDYGVSSYNVSSYTELYEAIEKSPYAEINVTQDFKVEGKYAEKVIPMYSGVLNGNGYTISGATHSLFKEMKDAEIKNLLLDKVDIMNTSELAIGGLAGKAENTKVHNVHVTNSKILSSSTDTVSSGGLVGESNSTVILNSTVQETEVSGSYVGGVTGVADNSKLLNVYSTGEVKN
ncbi:hypothetical protein OPL82_002677, partial [Enterococcus faecalis]|nr:hypothetical protein [Enterococcus faecalis]